MTDLNWRALPLGALEYCPCGCGVTRGEIGMALETHLALVRYQREQRKAAERRPVDGH